MSEGDKSRTQKGNVGKSGKKDAKDSVSLGNGNKAGNSVVKAEQIKSEYKEEKLVQPKVEPEPGATGQASGPQITLETFDKFLSECIDKLGKGEPVAQSSPFVEYREKKG